MISLHINIDHVATVRQARQISEPDPVTAAGLVELAGADGITIHLREDRRHIIERDVRILRETVQTRLNLEMAATAEMFTIALDIRPNIVTLVPEKREEVTTEGGLDVVGSAAIMHNAVKSAERDNEYERLVSAAELAHQEKLQVNAGHGLNYINTQRICGLPHLRELNIGHSIVSRAIFVGISQAVQEMREIIILNT